MRKNSRFLILVFLLLIVVGIMPIEASSGKLKGASIVNCGGQNYGNHGDGHWHRATKHDAGWYPDGENLGYSNPCSSNSSGGSSTTYPQAKESNADRLERQKAEAARKEAEAARVEAERLERERLEAERIKAEEEAALKLEEENRRLNDTSLVNVKVNDNLISNSETTIMKNDDFELVAQGSNEKASIDYKFKNDDRTFALNSLILTVLSENGESTLDHEYDVFLLGSSEDFLKQEVVVSYKDAKSNARTVNLSEGSFDLSVVKEEDLKNIEITMLSINDFEIATPSFKFSTDDSASYFVNFNLKGYEYVVPVVVGSNSSSSGLLFVFVATSGLIYYVVKRRKK